jgi:pimeloyl-ACP methyl ester carboxylesterase
MNTSSAVSEKGHSGAERPPRLRRSLFAGLCVYGVALLLMHMSVPSGVTRESVSIAGPDGKPCVATVWRPNSPKAIMLIGHGVTSNQGVMATIAKAFAANGYTAVTLDFWGHGRSRERFDWSSNAAQLKAWFAWAHGLGGLPMAYLGHSMGGMAGANALAAPDTGVSAFVSLGMLPGNIPACKTAVAAGRFEELFSEGEARAKAGDKADVIISPFSDHSLEPLDPVLLERIVTWVNGALGLPGPVRFPWGAWARVLLATVFGCVSAFWLAGLAAGMLPRKAHPVRVQPLHRRWSVNPYRFTGRLLGRTGMGDAPRSGSFLSALVKGVLFSAVFALLLSWVLDGHMFTSGLAHPGRFATWCIFAPFLLPPLLAGAWVLERVDLGGMRMRFFVSALTRCAPLLLLSAALFVAVPRLAFGCMILCIWAFIMAMLSAVHAVTTHRAADYRAGAVASAVLLAWTLAYWLPLSWPWIR